MGLYPGKKILGHLLRDPDAVSDFEEEDANSLPRRITAYWRSAAMEDIVQSIDHTALLRAKTAQKKMSVRGLLARQGSRAASSEERELQDVPSRFPKDAYSPKYLAEVGEFQAEHLASEEMQLDDLAKEMTKKSFGTGYNRATHGGNSHSAAVSAPNVAAGHQAGSSSNEVHMSG